MTKPQIIFVRTGNDIALNRQLYLDIVKSLEKDDSSQASQTIELLEREATDYLASNASHADPQALELLLTHDGKINHGVYWAHLEHVSGNAAAKDRLKSWLLAKGHTFERR